MKMIDRDKRGMRWSLLVALCGIVAHEAAAGTVSPEVLREYGVARKSVFAFTEKPSVKRNGDRIEIRFAVKAYCDVAVAIEDANGKIVRHLISGVLGPNAPAPLQKNTLKQNIVWDGKDDFGRYVDDKDELTIRVSLGLDAQYEKSLHTHTHKNHGIRTCVRAGKRGVYVFQTNFHKVNHYLRQYDHNGDYLGTVYPFPADKLKAIKGLDWFEAPPDGKRLPLKDKTHHGCLLPLRTGYYNQNSPVTGIVVRDPFLGLIGAQHLIRLTTDGTSGERDIKGARTTFKVQTGTTYASRAVVSRDGKWIYFARAVGPHPHRTGVMSVAYGMDHMVYRMEVDGLQPPKHFLGGGAGNDSFRFPSSISVDSKERIYVADWENNRVQVFKKDGTFFKSLPVKAPAEIVVHQKTDEIYVFTWQFNSMDKYGADKKKIRAYNTRGAPRMLRKFAPIENPKLLMEAPLPVAAVQAEVDSWSPKPMVWFVTSGRGGDNVYVYAEENGRLILKKDFRKEVAKAKCRDFSPRFQRQFLYYDSKREVLYIGETNANEVKYFSGLWHIDIKTGKQGFRKLPFACADAAFDANGHLHLMNHDIVARFNPQPWREIPYDYGEQMGGAISVVKSTGGHTSSCKHFSMGVSPQGDVIVAGAGAKKTSTRGNKNGRTHRWTPTLYPGRPSSNIYVHIFDRHGKIKHEDVLPGAGILTGGLTIDGKGNIYAAIRKARIVGGKRYPNEIPAGTLAKIDPRKGRFLTSHKPAIELKDAPKRPKDVGGLWLNGAEWFYGGVPTGNLFHCFCRHGRFKLDAYSRTFVPEFWRYCVAVLDPAGNVITRIGQYGNADSAGPKSKVPLGGDEIGLFDPHFVATHTDKRLFISDVGNGRIVSATLKYHATEKVALEDVPDAGKK